MSDLARKKELCAKVIRSHLISSPAGLTISQLERDYEASEGRKLPYRQFGHTDVLSLAKCLPDVVRIEYRNGYPILHAIADRSTIHMKILVDRNKKSTKKSPTMYLPSLKGPTSRSLLARRHDTGHVSALVRRNIHKVVNSQTSGIALPEFLELYKKETGLKLSADRHGFKSLPLLFFSIPDACRLEYGHRDRFGNNLYVFPPKPSISKDKNWTGTTVSSKSGIEKPRMEPILENKELEGSVEIKQMNKNVTDAKTKPLPHSTNLGTLEVRGQNVVGKNLIQNKKMVIHPQTSIQRSEQCRVEVKGQPSSGKLVENEATGMETSEECKAEDRNVILREKKLSQNDMPVNHSETPILASYNIVRKDILKILEDSPDGVWSSKISTIYKEKYKKELVLNKLGYFSIVEFVSTFSDEISISRPLPKSDWFLKKRSPTTNRKRTSRKSYCDDNIEITKMEIKEMLIKVEEGILLEKLQESYQRIYRHPIELEDESVNELMNLVLEIEGACLKRKKGRLIAALIDEERVAMGGLSKSPQVPHDAVFKNVTYKLLELPSPDCQFIDVFVADVTNPEHFVVQIRGRNTTGALNELMDALEMVYCSDEGDKYAFPDNMLKVGQICAAIFIEDLNWHRAFILSVYGSDFVDVLYVDYGSVATVPITSLRLLKSEFLHLPAQMVKARLSNIQPRDLTSWTMQARNCMLDMCRDRPLVALITGIKDRVLSLCLCDTSNSDVEVHINDTLVEKKHAVYFPDGLRSEQNSSLKEFLLQLLEAEKAGEDVDLENAAWSLFCDGNLEGGENEQSQDDHTENQTLDRVPSVENPDNEKTKDSDVDHTTFIIPRHILGGKHMIHIINYEGNPMIPSFEISRLFHQTSDMLRPLLLMKNLRFEELIICSDDKHAKLFKALYEMKVIDTATSGDVTQSIICLYRFCDLPEIVRGIGHENEAVLISDIVRILKELDSDTSDSNFLKGQMKEDNAEIPNFSTMAEELEYLSEERRVLIGQLANESNGAIVDKVMEIEKRISMIREKIKRHEITVPKEVGLYHLHDQMTVKSINDDVEATEQMSNKLESAVKVAEVSPYIHDSALDSELTIIPDAQLSHDIVDFTPHSETAVAPNPTRDSIVQGASGGTNIPKIKIGSTSSSVQGALGREQSTQVVNMAQERDRVMSQIFDPQANRLGVTVAPQNMTFVSRGTVPHQGSQPQMAVGVTQWTQWPVAQQQYSSPPIQAQLVQNSQGQVYLSQMGSRQPELVYHGHGQGMAIQQTTPFSMFVPLQGMR